MTTPWKPLWRALAPLWAVAGLLGCWRAPTPEARGAWSVQWWTDFREPGPWLLDGGPGAIATYTSAGYRLAGVMPAVPVQSLHPTAYAQVRLAAHVEADPSAASRGAYGLVCGYRDPQHQVVLALGSDGTFAAWEQTPAGKRPLHGASLDFVPHAAVHPAPQSNRMMVECRDTGLRLWVNGHLLLATDTPVPKGQVGMWLRTPPQGATSSWGVTYHDLTLWTWQRP
ncbi:MAG: hypothetical protein GXO37_02970 [Chloroflexi bacterium]|nr:hypothetical protein [Chloroflexota bacterium]